MDRRDLLKLVATGIVGPGIMSWPLELGVLGHEIHAAGRPQSDSAWRTLNERESRTLAAACDGIIPADDTPGAVAAGVPAFIHRVLADWCTVAERRMFVDGLRTLDDRVRDESTPSFADATPAQQARVLDALDAEYRRWRRSAQPTATPGIQEMPLHPFGMLKTLTIWGYYTSEIGQRQELGTFPAPARFDGCAPYTPRARRGTAQAVEGS